MHGMLHDQEYRYTAGEEGASAAHQERQVVKRKAAIPELDLLDCLISMKCFPGGRVDILSWVSRVVLHTVQPMTGV